MFSYKPRDHSISKRVAFWKRTTQKHGIWKPDSGTGNRKPESGTGNQSPDSGTGNQIPESGMQNPDIMNDDRNNSHQRCLINIYKEKLFCYFLRFTSTRNCNCQKILD